MLVSPAIYLDALFLLLGDNSERSRSLVKEFLEITDKQNGKREITTSDDELIDVYKSLIRSVIAERTSQENQTASKMLLLKIKSNNTIKAYPMERDILTDVLSSKEPITSEQINECLKKLRNILITAEMDAASRKMFAGIRAMSDLNDSEQQDHEIIKLKAMLNSSVKSIEQRQQNSETTASETYVSLSDTDSLKRSLTKYMDRNVKGVLKSGLQGLNKALGDRGGIGLGETADFLARSHNYKSGILNSWMIWAIIHNQYEVEPGKRAMVYFVSVENEVHQNLMTVFKTLYYKVEQQPLDIKTLSTEYITDWLKNYFSQFNVDLLIDRYTPHEFSFGKFTKRYNSFIDMNYQIVAFILDYLSEVRGIDPDDTLSSQGQIQLIKENYTKFGNHAKQLGYAFITAHQLTKKADEIAGSKHYAVKHFNPSMIADSSDVFRSVDIVVYLNIENNIDEVKFLTGQCRKNRGNEDTPERDKFFAYPFTPFGIQDDIDGLNQSIQDLDAYNPTKTIIDSNAVSSAMF